jgi:HK97 family phage major capsid protein
MYTSLRDQLESHATAAKALTRRAQDANRDLTQAEFAEAQAHIDACKELAPRVKAAKADDQCRKQLAALGPDGSYPFDSAGSFPATSGYKASGSQWATDVAGLITKAAQRSGVKDLASGSLDIPNVVSPAVEIPARPATLLDLIPKQSLPGNVFAYYRQTARTNNASAVADHATKPTSTYTFVETEDRARVFAHLSQAIALRYLDDFSELMSILDVQMHQGITEELEDNIVAGDGTGEFFTGFQHTSGVLTTDFATSVPVTLRNARTALEVANESPTAWLMHPTDLAALDLLADVDGRFHGPEVMDRLMGNLPKVSTTAVPAGTALLGDFRLSRLFVREEATLSMDSSGDLFKKNEVIFRVEGRFGFAVLRPAAFNIVSLVEPEI